MTSEVTRVATTAAASNRASAREGVAFDMMSHLIRRPEIGALVGTLAVYFFFAVFGGGEFTSSGGTASWLNVAAELGIIALPVGLLMIAGELDLSVGSVVAASSLTMAIVSGYWGMPMEIGIALALLLGVVTGFLNGLIVTRTRVPSFVATLATDFALAGATLGLCRVLTGTVSIAVTRNSPTKAVFGALIDGKFEVAVLWWLAVFLVVGWVLHVTRYGNWIFAIGGDKESALTTGIPVQKVKIGLFMGSGFAAALVGVIQTALYNGAQVATGQSFVFNSIIAVVIGGVLLTGGYGSVVGVAFGTLTFAIVNQGIYYTSWNSDWASLILGILLLAAVVMNTMFRKFAFSYASRAKKGAS
jgi:simple sugar transport system permease protein